MGVQTFDKTGALKLYNPNPLIPFSGAGLAKTATQSIPNSSVTILSFDSLDWDTHGYYDVANPNDFTIPFTGHYMITGSVRFDTNSTGVRSIFAYVWDGVSFVQHSSLQIPAASSNPTVLNYAIPLYLLAGNRVQLRVFQTSGGNLNVPVLANFNWFRISLLQAVTPVPTNYFKISQLYEPDGTGPILVVDSSGHVGILDTTPGSHHAESRDLVIGDGVGHRGMTIFSANANRGTLHFSDVEGSPQGGVIYDHSLNHLQFAANGAVRAQINDNHQLIAGAEPTDMSVANPPGMVVTPMLNRTLINNPQFADDTAKSFSIANRSFIFITNNGEAYFSGHLPYNNTINTFRNSGAFSVVAGGGTLTGTTGPDGTINLRMGTGTFYIENRLGGTSIVGITTICQSQ